MQQVVLAVIFHQGRVVVEQLSEAIQPEFRGVPVVLPGGYVKEGEALKVAIKRKVVTDIGITVQVEGLIATRAHPLFPESSFTYFFCTVIGTATLSNHNRKKIINAQWVDINTAATLMLTLHSKVVAFMIRQVYGITLPKGTTLPELAWLAQDFELFGQKVRAGELVAFPTETVYGIGANAFDSVAVAKIFKAKNRPADNPLIVHVPSLEAVEQVAASIDNLSAKLLERLTPGPITVLLPKKDTITDLVTAGSPFVGVRIPANLFALEFLAAAKVPIAAPSANKSGKPSATHHAHVIEAFGKEVPNVICAGKTFFGLESTVVLPKNGEQLVILRQGAITKENLTLAFPGTEVIIATINDATNAPSPGIRQRHYAPTANVTIVPRGTQKSTVALIKATYRAEEKNKRAVAILCSLEMQKKLPGNFTVIPLGSEKEPDTIAKSLYSALLECDSQGVTKIIIQSFSEAGLGQTLMERIRRISETE
ncbi:threonylcarbamoyl-AMP synthase [Candidatus Dojkabacteria bacterium CG_4_10_14_0_2_um_filter_Dojkabacteria_WS6_41_15]|uniref:L-threonylcarbamoyladenylate synthase n=1 Tax=Candidatus Dojkabacteria bacterium CG_4_10_14_0_2_um_filter_Dojkabacteria_WS6_41_15 TaxID=2014249 RepID=A0A2M7W248_9BACT|nr:MAG: threonylcarbamoyl-AMP synthase [Candidatus Dojkabacteria bacterium CG_4_10_14_0_2_um_filter_Dojkabacteria_WS6_41_15]